jgi:hypothetical protein
MPDNYRSSSTGLTLEQRKLLACLLEYPDWTEAVLAWKPKQDTEVSIKRLRNWLTKPDFRAEYNKLGEFMLGQARAKLDSLGPKAAQTYEEALGATTQQEVECPDCGSVFHAPLPDWTVRLRVSDNLFKRAGDLSTTTSKVKMEAELNVNHRLTLTLEDQLAIARLQRALPVPPDVLEGLRVRGLLPSQAGADDTSPPIEADWRELGKQDRPTD